MILLQCCCKKSHLADCPTGHQPPPPQSTLQAGHYLQSGKSVTVSRRKEMLVTQSWPALHDLLDSSLPGFSIHGIFQARILEWVVIPFSSGFSWRRDWTCVSCSGRQIMYHWATWETEISWWMNPSDWNKFTLDLCLRKGVWKKQFSSVQPFLLEAI